MSSVYSKNLNIFNAEQFKESVSEAESSKLYFTIGKPTPWANDTSPTQANTSVATLYEVYRNMIGGKIITGNDIYHCIPKNNWVQGTVYDRYDNLTSSEVLFGANTIFYVVTPNWDVYKCISNNNDSPSQNVPTQKSVTATEQTADGYIWKYMYTVSPVERLRFTTDKYIPVKTLKVNDNSLQWQVQENATDGSIEYIAIIDGGINYKDNTKIWISITGDGTGANAYVQTNAISNTISNIVIDNTGLGYTYADIRIYDDSLQGTGASLRAVISPPGGHGSDPLRELGGSNLIINARLRYDENGKLPVTNDFRQVALIKDPLIYGSTTVRSNTSVNQLTTLTLSNISDDDYAQDEIVYQGANLANATFKGTVVYWDGISQIKLSNVIGNIKSEILTGLDSGATGVVSIPYTNPDLQPNSGQLLYIDNVQPITRSSDQIEDFKIVLKF